MKNIYNYKDFINEQVQIYNDIKISLNDIIDILVDDEIDLYTTLNIDPDVIKHDDNIHELYDNASFNKSLEKKKLKKDTYQDTDDYETLLSKNDSLRFFFILDKNEINVAEPKYIALQTFNHKSNKKSNIRLFKNKNHAKVLLNKLSSANIEISNGDEVFIYQTSNSGNNWELKNPKSVQNEYKDSIDKKEMKKLLKDKKNKILSIQ